ncbi:MAG: hypothetical protein R3C27_16120 [Hyphomonadaceae bacterium]
MAAVGYAIDGRAPNHADIVSLGAAWLAVSGIVAIISAVLTLVVHVQLQRMELRGAGAYVAAVLLATFTATILFPVINCPARCEYDVCSGCGAIGWVTYFLAVIVASSTSGASFWLIRRPDRDVANPATRGP